MNRRPVGRQWPLADCWNYDWKRLLHKNAIARSFKTENIVLVGHFRTFIDLQGSRMACRKLECGSRANGSVYGQML